MTPRNQRRFVRLCSLCLWGISGIVVYWGRTSVPDIAPIPPRNQSPRNGSSDPLTPPSAKPLTTPEFEPYWPHPLRRPLYDPPPAPPQVIVKPPPRPITARLLATMIEPGNSMAMLKLANGEVVFRKSGEALGGEDLQAKIVGIESGVIRVRNGDEETRLVVPGRGGE